MIDENNIDIRLVASLRSVICGLHFGILVAVTRLGYRMFCSFIHTIKSQTTSSILEDIKKKLYFFSEKESALKNEFAPKGEVNPFSFREEPFSERTWGARKQTGIHKNFLPCNKTKNIQSVSGPLKSVSSSDVHNDLSNPVV